MSFPQNMTCVILILNILLTRGKLLLKNSSGKRDHMRL